MNRLPLEERVRVIASLCEGASIRATVRMTSVAKSTILRLLAEVGDAADAYQNDRLRGLSCQRIQADEIWSFVQKKANRVRVSQRDDPNQGDIWVWVAMDADTKLIVSWVVGKHTMAECRAFINDLRERLEGRVQITTDGLRWYLKTIEEAFGDDADYGQVMKMFAVEMPESERRYSPPVCTGITTRRIQGQPDEKHISTSYVEKQNHTMRSHIRRMTRLTNAFSKKAENFRRAVALHYFYYNFVKIHGTLKTTPAIAAGVTDRVWTVRDIAELPDLMRGGAAA